MLSLTTRPGSHSLQVSRPSSVTFLPSPESSQLLRVPIKTDFSAPRRSLRTTINLASHPYPTIPRYGRLYRAAELCSYMFSEVEKCNGIPVRSRRHSYYLLRCVFLLAELPSSLLRGFQVRSKATRVDRTLLTAKRTQAPTA